jgi:hypothetical protein
VVVLQIRLSLTIAKLVWCLGSMSSLLLHEKILIQLSYINRVTLAVVHFKSWDEESVIYQTFDLIGLPYK